MYCPVWEWSLDRLCIVVKPPECCLSGLPCLCSGLGACGAGVLPREPDVSLCMSEQDLLAMFQGVLRPFAAYSSGRLRVQGDLNTAMKLEALIKHLKTT